MESLKTRYGRRPTPFREILRRLCCYDGRTQIQIVGEPGCSRRTTITWMNHFDRGPGSDAPKRRISRLPANRDADVIGDLWTGGIDEWKRVENRGL
jgi:hypothetical protein